MPRHLTNFTAKLYSSSAPTASCSILNMSECGARLEFEEMPPHQSNFMLIIDGLGQVFSGTVRWRHGKAVGIEFLGNVEDLLN